LKAVENVTVNDELIEHISSKNPPRQEAINAVEATLREQWDPTNHIENLFESVKQGTETLPLMKAITKKVLILLSVIVANSTLLAQNGPLCPEPTGQK
jgi:hypothetical protein